MSLYGTRVSFVVVVTIGVGLYTVCALLLVGGKYIFNPNDFLITAFMIVLYVSTLFFLLFHYFELFKSMGQVSTLHSTQYTTLSELKTLVLNLDNSAIKTRLEEIVDISVSMEIPSDGVALYETLDMVIAPRVDSLKYSIGTLLLLGLLGTFLGLADSIFSLKDVMPETSGDLNAYILSFMSHFDQALDGISLAFGTSIFGIVSSLLLALCIHIYSVNAHRARNIAFEEWTLKIWPVLCPESSDRLSKIIANSFNKILSEVLVKGIENLRGAIGNLNDVTQDIRTEQRQYRTASDHNLSSAEFLKETSANLQSASSSLLSEMETFGITHGMVLEKLDHLIELQGIHNESQSALQKVVGDLASTASQGAAQSERRHTELFATVRLIDEQATTVSSSVQKMGTLVESVVATGLEELKQITQVLTSMGPSINALGALFEQESKSVDDILESIRHGKKQLDEIVSSLDELARSVGDSYSQIAEVTIAASAERDDELEGKLLQILATIDQARKSLIEVEQATKASQKTLEQDIATGLTKLTADFVGTTAEKIADSADYLKEILQFLADHAKSNHSTKPDGPIDSDIQDKAVKNFDLGNAGSVDSSPKKEAQASDIISEMERSDPREAYKEREPEGFWKRLWFRVWR